MAGFNRLLETTYRQEVNGNLDPYPHSSNVNHNDRTNMDASGKIEEQTAVNLSPNTAKGCTYAPAAVTGDSTTTLVEGEKLLLGKIFQATQQLLWWKGGLPTGMMNPQTHV